LGPQICNRLDQGRDFNRCPAAYCHAASNFADINGHVSGDHRRQRHEDLDARVDVYLLDYYPGFLKTDGIAEPLFSQVLAAIPVGKKAGTEK